MELPSSKIIPFSIPAQETPHWDSEEIFHNGDAFFSRLLFEIDQAQSAIDLEMYIFELDELGMRVLESLQKAARRGVQVRVMVDGVGSPDWSEATLRALRESGVEARIFRPYPWVRIGWRFFPKLFNPRKMARWFRVLNRRNHRKVCLIDGRIAWVGSFNITKNHLQEFSGDEAWRDTGVRVEGTEVKILRMAFLRAWGRAWSSFRRKRWFERRGRLRREEWARPQPLVRLNFAQFLRKRYYEGLLHRIWASRERIWIATAYFIPERSLIRALQAAAWGGVDVRILLPRKSDVKLVRWVSTVIFHWLLRSGVRLFEYLPSVLHAKTVMIDEWAAIGSSNLNQRSLHLDLEVDVVVEQESSIESLKKQFSRDLDFSEELMLEKWEREFWWERFLGRILFFLRYWM